MVEAYVFGNGLSTAEVGKEWEENRWNGRGSGWWRPTEIGYGKYDLEVATFTSDFIECHGWDSVVEKGKLSEKGMGVF